MRVPLLLLALATLAACEGTTRESTDNGAISVSGALGGASGDKGLSQKSGEAGNASYHYSTTRLAAAGQISLNGAHPRVQAKAWVLAAPIPFRGTRPARLKE